MKSTAIQTRKAKSLRHSSWGEEESDQRGGNPASALIDRLNASLTGGEIFSIRQLTVLIRHADEEVRNLALSLIEYQNDPAAIPAMLEAAADEEIGLATGAADVLRYFRNPGADQEIIGGLRHPHLPVRLAAIAALRERRSPAAVEPLVTLLGDIHSEVRREAVLTLAGYHREDLLLALRSAVRDGDPTVRRIAVESLEDFNSSAVFGDLLTAFADESWQVRRAAAKALGRFPGEATAFALRTSLDDPAWQVVAESLGSLAKISASVDRTILGLLHHERPEVRLTAATVIGQANDAIYAPYLGTLLHDTENAVKKAARLAIARLTAVSNETNSL